MIQSFSCDETRAIYEGQPCKRFQGIRAVAERKLTLLEAAAQLADLASPPGNRLEALKGDLAGSNK